jgi:hypothetical protein
MQMLLASGSNTGHAGIRKAAAWYTQHIELSRPPIRGKAAPKRPTVVLLTEDVANRQKAEKDKIVALSVRKYVEGTKEPSRILDLLAAEGEEIEPTRASGKQQHYPEVWCLSDCPQRRQAHTHRSICHLERFLQE